MSMPQQRRRSLRGVAVLLATLIAVCSAGIGGAAPAQAARQVPITGVGSSWSAIAIAAWVAQVKSTYQLDVSYEPSGSSNGRKQFAAGVPDFGVSEIPYGLVDNGQSDSSPRPYVYMPIVAGGTSFMYNLKIGGKRVTKLRLSGETIVKIFTGQITNWSDPAIKTDNPNLTLPARKIVVVVRSDGSGTTAQFSTWMSKKYASDWNAFCQKAGRSVNPCGVTSIYPTIPGMVAQAGSTGVAGYVQQSSAEGAITYVEYGYATNAGFPVVSLLNAAGYYVQPTASNVAVGLLGAKINNDASNPATYLTQILDGVYDNGDKRAYPLSSYSYMILPTKTDTKFTTDKGYTLGKFGYYFLCQGQQNVERLGYSPLPINLVQAGFEQLQKVPGVETQSINIAGCNNPTFSSDGKNTIAEKAPQPEDCQQKGPTQCLAATDAGAAGATKGASRTAPGSTAKGANPTGTVRAGASPGSTAPGGSLIPGGAAPSVDPETGQTVTPAAPAGDGGDAQQAGGQQDALSGQPVSSVPVSLAADAWGPGRTLLMSLAVLLLLGVALAPPIIAHWSSARGRSR